MLEMLSIIPSLFTVLPATMVFEARDGGTGSGGYSSDDGGTDRSQQASPHIADPGDWEVKGGVFTRLYSVTEDANLTADLVDNTIKINGGTNFITGIYHISGQGNDGDNYLDLDRACASGNSNDGSGVIGGAIDLEDLDGAAIINDGMKIWVKGTHTLGSNLSWTTVHGGTVTVDQMIYMEGYTTTRGDGGDGDNYSTAAVIDCGALRSFKVGQRWHIQHLSITGSLAATIFQTSGGCMVEHVKCVNTTASNIVGADMQGTGNVILASEFVCTGGTAVQIQTDCSIERCYAHDSARGINMNGDSCYAGFNIVENCTTSGISTNWTSFHVIHNTIDTCVKGFDGSGNCYNGLIAHNQFTNNTSVGAEGASWAHLRNNNYYNNGANVGDDFTEEDDSTPDAPGYTDPSGTPGDFSGVDDSNADVVREGAI